MFETTNQVYTIYTYIYIYIYIYILYPSSFPWSDSHHSVEGTPRRRAHSPPPGAAAAGRRHGAGSHDWRNAGQPWPWWEREMADLW